MAMLTALSEHVFNSGTAWRGVVPEVSARDGRGMRRADALVFWNKEERWAVEIKAGLKPLLAELATPEKFALWRDYTHRFVYLVPEGVVSKALDAIPEDVGVISALDDFQVHRLGAWNPHPQEIPVETWCRLAIRSGRQSHMLRKHDLPVYHTADSWRRSD